MKRSGRSSGYCAGVDGGATRTRCAVGDMTGRILGAAVAGPSNPLRSGTTDAASEIARALNDACREAGIDTASILSLTLGVAGTRMEIVSEDLTEKVREIAGIEPVTVVTDAEAAFTGAVSGGRGVIALAGTGFVAFGMDTGGRSRFVDGLGPLLGDEGSGYSIGREGLRSAARELDWGGARTKLTESILEALGVQDIEELKRLVSRGELETGRVASLAPLVLSASGKGNLEATLIVEAAASRITDSVRVVVAELELGRSEYPVVLGGSLLEDDNPLRSKVTELIADRVPGAFLEEADMPPVTGALAMAMSAGDLMLLEKYLGRLKQHGKERLCGLYRS